MSAADLDLLFLVGVIVVLCGLGLIKCLDMLEDWRQARANRKFTADLIARRVDLARTLLRAYPGAYRPNGEK